MTSPDNADIGYRFGLKDPDACDEYEEGDVVGFFRDGDGKTAIELLDNNNTKDAFMAGVISRSAYIEATQGLEKGTSDTTNVYATKSYLSRKKKILNSTYTHTYILNKTTNYSQIPS
jgi:uncharacterized protein YciU (UPF0263 family)